jgi:molybdopterin biosynthesis enzyme MoaB
MGADYRDWPPGDNDGEQSLSLRACAGLARGTYIFCLPGSPGAWVT